MEPKGELFALICKTSERCFSCILLNLLEACCLEAVFILETTALISLAGSEALFLAMVFPWVPTMNNLSGILGGMHSK